MKKQEKNNQLEGVKIWLTGFLVITIPLIIIELVGATAIFYLNAGGESLESRIGILAYFIQAILGAVAIFIIILPFAVMLFIFSDVIYPIFWSIPIAIGRRIFRKDKEEIIELNNLTYAGRHWR